MYRLLAINSLVLIVTYQLFESPAPVTLPAPVTPVVVPVPVALVAAPVAPAVAPVAPVVVNFCVTCCRLLL